MKKKKKMFVFICRLCSTEKSRIRTLFDVLRSGNTKFSKLKWSASKRAQFAVNNIRSVQFSWKINDKQSKVIAFDGLTTGDFWSNRIQPTWNHEHRQWVWLCFSTATVKSHHETVVCLFPIELLRKRQRALADGNQQQLAVICHSIGNWHHENHDYKSAQKFYEEEAEIYAKLSMKMQCARAHRMIGEMCTLLENFTLALEHELIYLSELHLSFVATEAYFRFDFQRQQKN